MGLYGDTMRIQGPMMENHMENRLENEMETGFIYHFTWNRFLEIRGPFLGCT